MKGPGHRPRGDRGVCFPVLFQISAKLPLLLRGALSFFLYCNLLSFLLPFHLCHGYFSSKLWGCSAVECAVRNIVCLYVSKLKNQGLKQMGSLFFLCDDKSSLQLEEFLYRLSSSIIYLFI